MALQFNAYEARHKSKIKALIVILIFVVLALAAVYFLFIRGAPPTPPPPGTALSEKDKLEILEQLEETNVSYLSPAERQRVLDQLVKNSPKRQ